MLAHPQRGLTWLGPEAVGLTTAMAVLADERRHTGMLPGRVDRWVDNPPPELDMDDPRMPGQRRSRYDRYGPDHETIRQRARRDSGGEGGRR